MDIQTALLNFLGTVIVTILGILANRATRYLKKKGVVATLQAKEASVMIAVDAVEQIARNEQVPDKFKAAKFMAVNLLNQQGVKITETELEAFIESAVDEMNKSAKDVLNDK